MNKKLTFKLGQFEKRTAPTASRNFVVNVVFLMEVSDLFTTHLLFSILTLEAQSPNRLKTQSSPGHNVLPCFGDLGSVRDISVRSEVLFTISMRK